MKTTDDPRWENVNLRNEHKNPTWLCPYCDRIVGIGGDNAYRRHNDRDGRTCDGYGRIAGDLKPLPKRTLLTPDHYEMPPL